MINWRKPLFLFILNSCGYKVSAILKTLSSIEFASPEEIAELQNKNLKDILLHSYENVPYYKKIFSEVGLFQDNRVCLERFKDIPFLTKDIIAEQGSSLYSKDHKSRKSYHNSSGGSTGQPVDLIQDRFYESYGFACRFLFNRWAGKDIGQPELKLWGSERDILQGSEKLSTKLRRWLFNTEILNAYKMSDSDMRSHVKRINQVKPEMIWAYTDSMYKFSQFIKENSISVHSPSGVICTTAPLLPEMRELIEQVFKCNVLNQYGSREVGPIAAECSRKEGLHIITTHQKIEIIDSDGNTVSNGQPGEIVLTNLSNYSMPLIRYKIGDTGMMSQEKCSCGRGFPLLKEVSGRVFSHFTKKDAGVVHGQFFVGLLFFKPWIKEFKVIQKKYDLIEIVIACNDKPDENDINDITNKIKNVMGDDCQVDFIFVDEVPPSSSGKYLYTVSEIEQN